MRITTLRSGGALQLVSVVAILLAGVGLVQAQTPVNDEPAPAPSPTPTPGPCAAADVQNLLLNVPVSSSSHIYVTGPYQGGTRIVEDGHDLEEGTFVPVVLDVASPGAPGSYCAYWIDDDVDPSAPTGYHFPSMRFDHPVRFAWTNQNDSTQFGVASANNTATIYPYGGLTPSPYTGLSDGVVGGVPVTFGVGEFAAEPVFGPSKTKEQPQPEGLLVPGGGGGCLQRALVIDGGDKKGWLSSGIASAADADGALVNTWLTGKGFTVTRKSQYWGNTIPGYPNGGQRNAFYQDIANYVATYAGQAVGANCHHEFFLYIGSHGSRGGSFFLYDTNGSGTNQGVSYAQTVTRLNNFPTDAQHKTTVYMFVDACYSGTAVTAAGAFTVMPANPGHWALQAFSATDSTHTAAGGHTIFQDSATEDFMEDSATITRGMATMVADAGGRNPQRLRSPNMAGANLFVLDP